MCALSSTAPRVSLCARQHACEHMHMVHVRMYVCVRAPVEHVHTTTQRLMTTSSSARACNLWFPTR